MVASINCCTGFLHPIIHLGFGLEFKQPAIIAEGLAQAAVHTNYMNKLFLPAEKAAASQTSSKGLVELLHEIRSDKKLSTAAQWKDDNKLRDGILVRAPEEMLKYASQYIVSEDELEEKTAEMTNAVGRSSSSPLPLFCRSCDLQYTSPAVRNVRLSKSNSTSTTCTASTALSSSLHSSLPLS